MKKIVLVSCLSVVLALPAVGLAKERPYGMAGCGLWSMVIKNKSKGGQLGVWFLRNFILNLQPSAITSGTMNCVPDDKLTAMEKKVFITANLNALSREAAQGKGELLNSLAEVMGCSDREEFAEFSKENYSKLFRENTPEKVLDNYINGIKRHDSLSRSCSKVS